MSRGGNVRIPAKASATRDGPVSLLVCRLKRNSAGGRERPQRCSASPARARHTDGGAGLSRRPPEPHWLVISIYWACESGKDSVLFCANRNIV